MNLSAPQGQSIRLPARYFSGGEPADPADPVVEIRDPEGRVTLLDAVPVRESVGVYHLDYPLADDAPCGIWTAQWTAIMQGQIQTGSKQFRVFPAALDRESHPRRGETAPEDPGGPLEVRLDLEGSQPQLELLVSLPSLDPRPHPEGPTPGRSREEGGRLPAESTGAGARSRASGPAGLSRAGSSPGAHELESAPPEEARSFLQGLGVHGDPAAATTTSSLPGRTTRRAVRPGHEPGEPDEAPRTGQDAGVPTGRRRVLLAAGALVVLLIAVVAIAALVSSPDEGESLEAGEAAMLVGNFDEARSHYLDVLDGDPDNKYAFYNLGLLAQIGERTPEAKDYYERSISADPDFLPALFNLALLEESSNQPGAAEALYRRIIQEYPDNAQAQYNLGQLLIPQGRTQEGQALIDEALALDPSLGEAQEQPPAPAPQPVQPSA